MTIVDFLKSKRQSVSNKPLFDTVCLFVAVFGFTLLLDVFVREILLPYIFPHLQTRLGFMVGGDSLGYHEKAVALAEKIRVEGWSQWELKPFDTLDTPAGIASALYVVFGPNPLVLLPFNALVHALSAVLLFSMMRPIFNNTRDAYVAVIPFVVFPTAIYWHSQLHKDGIFILGMYAFIAAWIGLLQREPLSLRRWLRVVVLMLTGAMLVWAVRNYMLVVMTALAAGLAMWVIVFCAVRFRRGGINGTELLMRTLFVALAVVGLKTYGGKGKTEMPQHQKSHYVVLHEDGLVASEGGGDTLYSAIAKTPTGINKGTPYADSRFRALAELSQNDVAYRKWLVSQMEDRRASAQQSSPQASGHTQRSSSRRNKDTSLKDMSSHFGDSSQRVDRQAFVSPTPVLLQGDAARDPAYLLRVLRSACDRWYESKVLPRFVDQLVFRLVSVREGYYGAPYATSGSMVDSGVCLASTKDVLAYLPRAAEFAFLAPFPDDWFKPSVTGGRVLRLVAGAEMLLVYVAMGLACLAIWTFRAKPQLWVVLFCSTPMLLLYAIVTPNIGALHRMRYGFLMLIVGLGVGWMSSVWRRKVAMRSFVPVIEGVDVHCTQA